jgi:hypothetical protein
MKRIYLFVLLAVVSFAVSAAAVQRMSESKQVRVLGYASISRLEVECVAPATVSILGAAELFMPDPAACRFILSAYAVGAKEPLWEYAYTPGEIAGGRVNQPTFAETITLPPGDYYVALSVYGEPQRRMICRESRLVTDE